MSRGAARTALLTAAALTGFAGNSLTCRLALAPGAIDPASFTTVRLLSGAVAMALLVRASGVAPADRRGGTWRSAAVLAVYAYPFSFAYTRLGAGTGALILFSSVQLTMIGRGLLAGERPRLLEWAGLAVALAGLVLLAAPGVTAPDPLGAALMVVAGVMWAAYTLLGRGVSGHPLAATAGNFARSLPFAAVASLAAANVEAPLHATTRGLAFAVASGVLASGVGYSFWFAALRGLTVTRAAILQLAVPAIAALGGVVLLDETVTSRLAAAGGAILGGVGLTLLARTKTIERNSQ